MYNDDYNYMLALLSQDAVYDYDDDGYDGNDVYDDNTLCFHCYHMMYNDDYNNVDHNSISLLLILP